ncbi:MAG: hypothetical protein AB1391_03160 [Candidatus Micrarchaeota archaeon]
MAKGHVLIEMLIIFVVALIIFITMFSVFSGHVTNVTSIKNSMDAFFIASTLGSATNSVFLAGNGTFASVNLFGKNATVWIGDRSLVVEKNGAIYDWPLLTNTTVIQSFPSQEISIKNIGGVVYIG